MSKHMQVFLGEADWQRLPEPHRTQFGDWLLEHGYRSLPWCSDEAWMEEMRRRTPPQVCATVLLHWLDEHAPGDCAGLGKVGDHWEALWVMDQCMETFPGPSPVQALWAGVLEVLGVTP